jgi:hypothetical protein
MGAKCPIPHANEAQVYPIGFNNVAGRGRAACIGFAGLRRCKGDLFEASLISRMRIPFMVAKWGPRFLFYMSNRTTVSYWFQTSLLHGAWMLPASVPLDVFQGSGQPATDGTGSLGTNWGPRFLFSMSNRTTASYRFQVSAREPGASLGGTFHSHTPSAACRSLPPEASGRRAASGAQCACSQAD